MNEPSNEIKIQQLLSHVESGVIGHGYLQPKFIRNSCETSNIIIYLQRIDNETKIPKLTKTLVFMTAKVRENNAIELELISTSIIYKGCGSNILNTFLLAAREAGFDNCYLYSLLGAIPFYQSLGFIYLGRMKGNKDKDYFYKDLTNSIKPGNISKISFDPPSPGTTFRIPTYNQVINFASPNIPYQFVQPSNLLNLKYYSNHLKTGKNGKRYVASNAFTRKRGISHNSNNTKRIKISKSKGRNKFKRVVKTVINKLRHKS